MSDIDKLFGDYEQRKQQELDAAAQQRIEEDRLRTISLNAIKQKISPVLQELAATINAKGHTASVLESFDNMVYPSVIFSFTPNIPSPPAYYNVPQNSDKKRRSLKVHHLLCVNSTPQRSKPSSCVRC